MDQSQYAFFWWLSILALTLLAGLTPWVPFATARIALITAFALWAPGAALIGLVPALDALARTSLAPGCSVGLLLLGSDILVQGHVWHPVGLLVGEGVLCVTIATSSFLKTSAQRRAEHSRIPT